MPDTLTEERVSDWNREVRTRVGEPLRPEALRSVLLIVPGSSGDVALATTVVRYIKDRNPDCRVSFAAKRSNLPLLRMCPGVDEEIEAPPRKDLAIPSRQNYLAKYAGQADRVVYPICVWEDASLLRRYNFLETVWLLAGVPDGMPPGPRRLWLTPPEGPEGASAVLRRCFSQEFTTTLVREARRQPVTLLGAVLRERKVRNLGWTHTTRLLRHASYVRRLASQVREEGQAHKFVIVSSEANALHPPADGLFEKVIQFLQAQGRIVLHNVLNPALAAPGTVPLVCSYAEFLSLRAAGVPFVGWRSGLCDIAAASSTPMAVIYPITMEGSGIQIMINCETPLKSFGFGCMNVGADCVELVADIPEDLDLDKLALILG